MIRFYNGKVITMDGSVGVSDNEVWTDGSVISYVGPKKDEMPVFEREIDLNGDIVLPGFKNAHTHSAMTFLRSYADDLPLAEWLNNRVFPLEARLTPDDIYWLTKLAVLEYLSGGTTASFDMYFYPEAYAAANIECGFRTALCGSLMKFDKRPFTMEDDYKKYNSIDPLVSYKLGFHAEYTNDLETLNYVSDLTHRYKAPVYAHISETESEVGECIERHKMTPTELFDSLGLFDYGGGGFHCVWHTEHDMEIFADRGLYAVTNPCSNLKLASGIAPLARMREKGVELAIGTDGSASNNGLDMFREMYLACVLQKYKTNDASAFDPEYGLCMAVKNGARAIGLNDCDCIACGKQADLFVIDVHRPNMQPMNNCVKNIVYSGSRDDVRLTMVAGKIRYERGEFFVGTPVETIYAKCAEAVKRLTADF